MSVIIRIITGLLLLAGTVSQNAWAETCQASTRQMTINFNNIRYLPALGTHMQMSATMQANGGGIHFTCDRQNAASSLKKIVYNQKGQSIATINGHAVFSASLPGIGYSLSFQCGGGPQTFITAGSSTVVCDSATLPAMLSAREITVTPFVTFYKTGDIQLVSNNHASSGALPGVGTLTLSDNGSGNGTLSTHDVSLDLAAMNVDIGNSGSCSVATGSIKVNLGKVKRTDFAGEGTTGGTPTAFSIPVYCTAPVELRIGFFGTPAVSGSRDALAVVRTSGGAEGVGVRLSYGNNGAGAPAAGTRVTLNDAVSPIVKHMTASSASAATPVNFIAQYVQTGATVTAGSANSSATFVLDYN